MVIGCFVIAGANRVKISEVGGIERIVIAMTSHEASGPVQKHGCGALAHVAANNGDMCCVHVPTC